MITPDLSVLLLTCGAWYLPQTAKAFTNRGALAGLWITTGNHEGIPNNKYRRAWPFQAAMLPLYRFAPQIWAERAFYHFFPLWKAWLGSQQFPPCNVVQAIVGYATEPFDRAEKIGALKVLDCPNSHPTTLRGFWQRECDLWCPGDKVPIPQWMFARMNREFERADIVIAQSKFCKESMIMNGIPANKIIVNLMGVDPNIFSRRTAVPKKVRFICVGTICLRKGHQYLFRAWEIVKRQLPDAELICLGDYKSDFRKERPKWEGKFTHRPHVSQDEVAKLLQSSTAFVFPSQEEGIARAQVEALACGVPLIGTHEGGATTLVDDGIEGLIVRAHDPEHIAAAMVRVALDRDRNETMGKAAYTRMATQSSWQHYGDRLLNEYQQRLTDR